MTRGTDSPALETLVSTLLGVKTCSAAQHQLGSMRTRCCLSPAMPATAAIGSRMDCSRSRWFRASAANAFLVFLCPRAVVGELSIIDGRPRSASAVAVRDSTLSFLSCAAFEEFAQNHPEVYKSLVRLLATRLRETDNVVAAGSFLPLRGRVAYTLLELAKYFGQDVGSGRVLIRQKIGQSDLAAMTGIVRETVNRILNDWKRRGWSVGLRVIIASKTGHYCKMKPTRWTMELAARGYHPFGTLMRLLRPSNCLRADRPQALGSTRSARCSLVAIDSGNF